MQFADRVYFYDNSVDDQNAQLLFRTTDGKFAKQYVDSLPEWTETITEPCNVKSNSKNNKLSK